MQGWSIAVAHDREVMTLVSATNAGTDAHAQMRGGFEATEEAKGPEGGGGASPGDGAGDDQADGFISAGVMSFRLPVTLDPTRAQSIARATYLVSDRLGAGGEAPAFIRFEDGLRGSGAPVENLLSVAGGTERPVHLIPLGVRRDSRFVRGDPNDDGRSNLADAIWSLNELVRGGPPTLCRRAADVNLDARYDVSDAIYLVQYLFLDGRVIPAPFPHCGRQAEATPFRCPAESVAACP